MAEIQMVCINLRCKYNDYNLNMQCITESASDTGCIHCKIQEPYKNFLGITVYPTNECVHAYMEYKFKGVTAKNYEMEEIDSPECAYTWMDVTIGKQRYMCVKVTIDGRCIYNIYDDEEVKGR